MSNFGVTAANTTNYVFPTAEDLAASSTSDPFGVTYDLGIPSLSDYDISTTDQPVLLDDGSVSANSLEIQPVSTNPVQNFLSSEQNRPFLIGAGVLIGLGLVYIVSNKKGGKK